MPLTPRFGERLMLLTLNQGPGLMLDFLGAQAFRAVCAGSKLGVFETLSGGPLTAAETARRIHADERGTTLLFEALEALGYVKKKNESYINTRMTVKWLLRDSPTSLAGGMPFFESMVFGRWGVSGRIHPPRQTGDVRVRVVRPAPRRLANLLRRDDRRGQNGI